MLEQPAKIQSIVSWLLCVFLCILPWQARIILEEGRLLGLPNEYTTYSLYATEVLLWIIILVFFYGQIIVERGYPALFSANKKNYRTVVVMGAVATTLVLIGLSPDMSLSWYKLRHLLEGALLLVVLHSVVQSHRDLFAKALWLGGLAQALLGLYQFFTQKVFWWWGIAPHSPIDPGAGIIEVFGDRWLRPYGMLGGPNPFGIYLAVLLVLGLALYIHAQGKTKIAIFLGEIIMLAGLLVSFSRGAYLALFVGTLAALWFHRQHFRALLWPLAIGCTICAISFFAFKPLFTARLTATGRLEQQSLTTRQREISAALQLIRQHPLKGVGLGLYVPTLSRQDMRPHLPVHNTPLLALTEVGLIGFIFLTIFFCRLALAIYQKNPWYIPVLLTLATASLFEHFLWSLYVGIVFWFAVWGIGVTPAMLGEATHREKA